MNISFATTEEEMELVSKVADRAAREISELEYPRLDLTMDLSACHANGTPLDFEKLLAFPAFDFCHDIIGILRHLDRRTGKLGNCFLPRCARA